MPQMAPYNWLFLSIYFNMILMICLVYLNFLMFNKFNYFKKSKNKNKFSPKW